ALRDLGIRWDHVIAGPAGGYIKDFTRSGFRVISEGSHFDDIIDELPISIRNGQGHFGIATSIGSQINILESRGMAWELAAPQLSARSGGEARFLAGGRIPVPVVGAFGQTNVQWEDYGIELEITPHVNADDQ